MQKIESQEQVGGGEVKGKKWRDTNFLGENVLVHQVIKFEFCIEMEIECDGFERRVGVIFIYASTDVNTRMGNIK